MDMRTMEYYLAVVREGTISAAAEALHVAQPSLSRQMKELEEELGAALFVRGNRKITLTEEGMIMRKRAAEMLRLLQMTKEEVSYAKNSIAGTVNIGAGESRSFHFLSQTAAAIAEEYPGIHFSVTSGDTQDLSNELSKGLIDFAVVFAEMDHSLYQTITLPVQDRYGVLMPKNHVLAGQKEVRLPDLKDYPVIISRTHAPTISGIKDFAGINVIATYNLIYNASLMVEDGLGLAITFDGLLNLTGDSPLAFRPLVPELKATGRIIWKKYQVLSPPVQLFIDRMEKFL